MLPKRVQISLILFAVMPYDPEDGVTVEKSTHSVHQIVHAGGQDRIVAHFELAKLFRDFFETDDRLLFFPDSLLSHQCTQPVRLEKAQLEVQVVSCQLGGTQHFIHSHSKSQLQQKYNI